jgi:hypothetical protein
MKIRIILLLITLFTSFSFSNQCLAQIEKVEVETYYIADSLDATDTINGRFIDKGTKTYRIYVDLAVGSKIVKLYGDINHTFRIESTANFYNNIDRPTAYFGYLINKNWFPDNPTLGLDSWLTIGLATKTDLGVLKTEDTNGSYIGGSNNYGGSFAVPGGILVNSDPLAGIPLTIQDGLLNSSIALSQWLDNGVKDFNGDDTTAFGSVNTGNYFISNDFFLEQINGVGGANTDSNKVLIGQISTTGDLRFELNLEVEQVDGATTKIVKYVANDNILLADEVISPFLKFPLECGCTDPDYLEYSESYGCSDPTACQTLIVFGCMDTAACNYDPDANFAIPNLCCYPGYCNDRDIELVCPDILNGRFQDVNLTLYPNPASSSLNIEFISPKQSVVRYDVYDSFGRLIKSDLIGSASNYTSEVLDISYLSAGMYRLLLFVNDEPSACTFIKQ